MHWEDVSGGKGKQTVINYIWKYQTKLPRARVGILGLITHLLYDFIEHSKYSRIRLRLPFRRAQPPPSLIRSVSHMRSSIMESFTSLGLRCRMTLVWAKFNYVVLWNLYDTARQQPHWVWVCVCMCTCGGGLIMMCLSCATSFKLNCNNFRWRILIWNFKIVYKINLSGRMQDT